MPDYESERDILGFTFEDYEGSRQSRALGKASRRSAPIRQLVVRIVRRSVKGRTEGLGLVRVKPSSDPDSNGLGRVLLGGSMSGFACSRPGLPVATMCTDMPMSGKWSVV